MCLSAGENSMEIKTEADSNDINDCVRHDHPYAAMSGVSDVIFSTFICLCMACVVFTMFVFCILCSRCWSSKLKL